MALLPDAVAKTLPGIKEQEHLGDNAVAHVKSITPCSNWTCYASEYDAEERICFGVVVGFERELGNFSLDELEGIRGPAGLRTERDLYRSPKPLRDCT